MKKYFFILSLFIVGCSGKKTDDHIDGLLLGIGNKWPNDPYFQIVVGIQDPDTIKTLLVDSTTYQQCKSLKYNVLPTKIVSLEMKKVDTAKNGRKIYTLSSYDAFEPVGSVDWPVFAPAE